METNWYCCTGTREGLCGDGGSGGSARLLEGEWPPAPLSIGVEPDRQPGGGGGARTPPLGMPYPPPAFGDPGRGDGSRDEA